MNIIYSNKKPKRQISIIGKIKARKEIRFGENKSIINKKEKLLDKIFVSNHLKKIILLEYPTKNGSINKIKFREEKDFHIDRFCLQFLVACIVMEKTTEINILIDSEIKKRLEKLFGSFGITITDAVNIFFNHSLILGERVIYEIQLSKNLEEDLLIREVIELIVDRIQEEMNVNF